MNILEATKKRTRTKCVGEYPPNKLALIPAKDEAHRMMVIEAIVNALLFMNDYPLVIINYLLFLYTLSPHITHSMIFKFMCYVYFHNISIKFYSTNYSFR